MLKEGDCEPAESPAGGLIFRWASSDFVELALFKMSRRRTEKRKKSGMSLLHPCLRFAFVVRLECRSG
jgi:hypothetical protein